MTVVMVSTCPSVIRNVKTVISSVFNRQVHNIYGQQTPHYE